MSYETFKLLCDQKCVTPAVVSRATGIATSTLTEWKKGRYAPKADKLAKIADYFGVSVDYLMTGEDKEYYIDPEAAAMAQKILQNRDLYLLFYDAQDAKAEDLRLAHEVLLAMKRKEIPD